MEDCSNLGMSWESDNNKPVQAAPFKPGGDLPNPLPLGSASRNRHADRGPDAQDDGRGGAFRHRQIGAAERILFRRQYRHRAEDRSSNAHLFEDDAHCVVRGLCAGQQSGDRGGDRDGLAERRVLRCRCFSARVRRCGATSARVPGRTARHRFASTCAHQALGADHGRRSSAG